ncbi:long-chain fatty acid--CoA ligase [Parafrankia colletiae]|uniref:Long-chain fatty acid--CoA ligase n=1 Tax=Parafrankia colletiae TaxID=573497 RepID=A0A1S1QHT9_9ACTN|nr:long-chain-fatty-acid--CoA ligase [Parafrankia colletiae]MCK9902334.1 long-chain-fatty-acid--CoA ligase [Frankia sp. Cpl3]OHV33149.1 long-chain fatty acid--CoA ligase [Parafrankia colletiae]
MIDPDAHTLTARSAVHAARRPDHVALICEDRELTYAQLHRESNRTGHALLAAGLRRGSRVAYLGRESEYYYDLVLGCAKSGTVLVPINWRLTAREVDHVLHDSHAEIIFVEEEFRPVVERVRMDLPRPVTVVTVDTPGTRSGGFLAWKAGQPDTALDPGTGPDDPVVQMYTSGTTGLPKGVVLAHRTYFVFIENIRRAGNDWIDWLSTDRALIAFPGLHSGGMAWFLHGFVVGWTSVVMRMFVPEEAVRLIRHHRITNTFAAPAMLQMMLDERGATPEAFSSLRKVVYGGAPMPAALMLRCVKEFGCELAQMYASAETGSVVTALAPHEHVPGHPKLGTAGRACPGNEVRIVDEQGRALPAGEIGQVCVRTPARFLEYWNRPDATAETVQDGWLHMPDAGYLDPDGYLVICDRINDMIIVAGQNIYPVEVENAIRTHPDVVDAAVVGVADPRWGEVVQAVVVARPDVTVTGRDLMRWLRGRIADFKIPNRYEFVDQLPRNPTGKVLRRELRARAGAAAAAGGETP